MSGSVRLRIRPGPSLAQRRAGGQFEAREQCVLVAMVAGRVREMLTDLGVAGCPVAVELTGPEERASRFAFSLEVEGKVCFGPLDRGSDVPDDAFARTVAATLFQHRDDLVAPIVRDWAWKRAVGRVAEDRMPRSAFDGFVAQAVLRGVGLPGAVDRLVSLFEGGLRTDEMLDQVEAVLAGVAEPAVRLRVAPTEQAAMDPLLKSVGKGLLLNLGLTYPPLELETSDLLESGKCQFAVNRLWSPPIPLDPHAQVESLVQSLRREARVFATSTAVDAMLGQLTRASPMAVFHAIELFGTTRTMRVLRALVDEGVHVRNLRTILGAMAAVSGTLPVGLEGRDLVLPYEANLLDSPGSKGGDGSMQAHVDRVRKELAGQISQAAADPQRVLHAFRPAPELEVLLGRLGDDAAEEEEAWSVLSACEVVHRAGPSTVIVASSRNRRRLWNLIRYEFPDVSVLGQDEISPYVHCDEIGVLGRPQLS